MDLAGSLRQLEFVLILKQSKRRLDQARDWARALSAESKEEGRRIFAASLLSASSATPYYLWFHIDRFVQGKDDKDAQKHMLVHLDLDLRPSDDPPEAYRKLRDAGKTMEWFLGEFSGFVKGEAPLVIVDATFRFDPGLTIRAPLAAPHLNIGDSTLQNTGAEYRAIEASAQGLHKLRWSRLESRLDVWLSYGTNWTPDAPDLWNQEAERCRTFLAPIT